MAKTDLTAQRLREVLHYDPETGIFTWIKPTSRRVKVGGKAGTPWLDGRIQLRVDGKICKAARLAWLYVTGEWPEHEIDHIDGNSANDRFANLRDVDRTTNQHNMRRANKNSKSGLLGAAWNPANRSWRARIMANGRVKEIGSFQTKEDAHEAYVIAKRELHAGGCTI